MSDAAESAGPGELESALGHRFQHPELLERALLHASRAHETGEGRGNERLEFLGDAVLDLTVASLLYETHPDWTEGELTRARAGLVNRASLAACARRLSLGSQLRLGRTEEHSAGAEKATILADALEAVIGAVFLDAGFGAALELTRRLFAAELAEVEVVDPKTAFQEWAHAERRITPRYRTVADSGQDNDERRFTVQVLLEDEVWGVGVGRSKRVAERGAARAAVARCAQGDG